MADGGKSCGVCAFLNKKHCQHLQYKPISYNSHHHVQVMGHLQQEVSHQFLFTIKTNCLLWAAGLWHTFQPQQFGMQSPLWQQLNASVNGDSISEAHCLLWAAWLWDTFQPKQFGMQSLLLQWLNESVEGDSISETHCLLWAAWLWDTFQPKQFGMQSLL